MEKVKLGNICIFIRNGANIKNDKTKKGIPITRIETISNGIIDEKNMGYSNIFDDKYEDYYLRQNDILMSHINSMKHLGKVAICAEDKKIIHGMNLLNIRLTDKVYPKYIYYFFKTSKFKKQLNKISKQSVNQSSFTVNDLKKILVCIPKMQDQEEIANNLDKIQEIIDIREKQIKELDKLIKSQFVKMFENEKYEKKTLQEITNKITDGSHNPPSGVSENSGYLMLSSQNIINDKINYDNARFLNKEDFDKENIRTDLKKGDVLLTIVGTVGRTAIIADEENITLQRSVAVLKPTKEIRSEYLVGALKSDDVVRQLNKGTKGVAQKGIYLNDLKKLIILLPPIELQNQFADIVKQIDKQKLKIQKSLDEVHKLQESLMNKYFGG